MTVLYMNSIYLFDNYLARFFLQREMFQTKVEEKIEKKNIFCSIAFFFEILAVCEIIWKNTVQPDIPQIPIRSMCAHYLTGLQT